MAYTLKELSEKYDGLWDQQDILFCEFSEIKNRQKMVEYANTQLIKMEENMKELHKRLYILNDKMSDIQKLLQILYDNKNKNLYNMLLFGLIIIICIIKSYI